MPQRGTLSPYHCSFTMIRSGRNHQEKKSFGRLDSRPLGPHLPAPFSCMGSGITYWDNLPHRHRSKNMYRDRSWQDILGQGLFLVWLENSVVNQLAEENASGGSRNRDRCNTLHELGIAQTREISDEADSFMFDECRNVTSSAQSEHTHTHIQHDLRAAAVYDVLLTM